MVTGELDSKVADDLKAVAAFPGEVPSWLYNRAERLGLPRYRIGQQYRYRLSEVAQWVERSREDASL